MTAAAQIQALQRIARHDANKVAVRLDRAARTIVEIMKEIHGGHWAVDINHQSAYVAISRNF